MSKARDLGDLLNTDGDVKSDSLDMVPIPTKATIEALGIELPAADITGTIADARIPTVTASKLTGTIAGDRLPDPLPAIDGSNLTGVAPTKTTVEALGIELPAANLTGTVAGARLGTGTASNTTFLRGDNSWQTAGSTSASDLTSGTLPDARLPDPLPAIDGSNLTGVAPTKTAVEALGIELPAADLTGTIANARFPTTLSNVSLASGGFYSNTNTITANATVTTASTKNMFLMGMITVNDTYTWTIAGDGVLQII
jgi:hypothetical protein